MTLSIDTIITLLGSVGTVVAIVFAFKNFSKSKTDEYIKNGREVGSMLESMGYIKTSIDEMNGKVQNLTNNYMNVNTTIVVLGKDVERLSDELAELKNTVDSLVIDLQSVKQQPTYVYTPNALTIDDK